MPNVRLTPDAHPEQIEKTLRYEAAHTSETMNRIQEELVGSTHVLNGFQVIQIEDGGIELHPGSFIAGGVIVTLKEELVLDYTDFIDADSFLERDGNQRKKAVYLYVHCENSSEFSPVTFGFLFDEDVVSTLTDENFAILAVLQSEDEMSATDDKGRWTRVFGFSNEELARDTREGIQAIEAIPFASDTGVLRTNPDFQTGPYFTEDHQLLVFADRSLLPSQFTIPSSPIKFSRRDIRGLNEVGITPAAFTFNGQQSTAQNIVDGQWGIIVSRDIEWQAGYVAGAAAQVLTPPGGRSFEPVTGRLLLFIDGLWIAPSEYVEAGDGLSVTLNVALTVGEVIHFVYFRDIVFLETVELTRDDLDTDTDVPQDYTLTLARHLYDRTRHSLMVFARLSGTAITDGGYIQINREGTGTRSGQEFIVKNGFEMVDGGAIKLRDVVIDAGITATIGVLCIRGSTKLNFLSADRTQISPFFRRWTAVASGPGENELQAFPTLQAFVTSAPGGSTTVGVALHDVDNALVAPDGTVIGTDQFEGYTLLQGGDFEDEAGSGTSPRSVSSSSSVAYSTPANFTDPFAETTISVPLGAQGALTGDPVKLQGGRTIEGLPPYAIGENKLRVAIGGVRMLRGIDFEELTDTSIVMRHPLKVGEFLEAWAE